MEARCCAHYVGRQFAAAKVLRGAKTAEIPVEQPDNRETQDR
jgi:hypothetical protein